MGVAGSGAVGASYRAFSLDRAVWFFGTSVEADMDKAEAEASDRFKNSKSKNAEKQKAAAVNRARQDVLNNYLQIKSPEKGKFAEPVKTRKRG